VREYIVKKPKEKNRKIYSIKKVERETFPKRGGKDVDREKMMGMQSK